MKTQLIRLVDVFVLGPFMLYAATLPRLSRTQKTALGIIGAATVIYNLVNYLETRKQESAGGGEAA